MTCSICSTRKAKRYCPALRSEICAQCCGQGREETIDCPLDCPYLIESRQHERRSGLSPEDFPYKEVRVTETFLREQEELLTATAQFVLAAAFEAPGAVDRDVRAALDSLARTYKSLESGVHYQTLPDSPVAQDVAAQIQGALQHFREEETRRAGLTHTRDVDVLGVIVFLLRMAIDHDNGRRLGRSFIDFLHGHFRPATPSAAAGPSPLIVPG